MPCCHSGVYRCQIGEVGREMMDGLDGLWGSAIG